MTFEALFIAASVAYGVPDGLLSSLCFIESSHRPAVYRADSNGRDSIGLCQIQYETAKWLGYKGTKNQLLIPETNVFWSAIYLKTQFDRYGDWIQAVKAYNAGHSNNTKHNSYSRKVYLRYERKLQRKPNKGSKSRKPNTGTSGRKTRDPIDTHR